MLSLTVAALLLANDPTGKPDLRTSEVIELPSLPPAEAQRLGGGGVCVRVRVVSRCLYVENGEITHAVGDGPGRIMGAITLVRGSGYWLDFSQPFLVETRLKVIYPPPGALGKLQVGDFYHIQPAGGRAGGA